MEKYLNMGIKEIIEKFPAVEDILNEYDIGCGPCTIGLCLLKDIVEIHRLPKEQEQQLMARIAKTIHPEKNVKVPKIIKQTGTQPKDYTYSPPVKKLVDEHLLIKRWISMIPQFVKHLNLESQEGRQMVLDGVDMIRSYADKYHHAKEEEILFKYFDENSEILQVMRDDHRQARNHVKAMLAALENKDKETLSENLLAYRHLLTEHIRKEDEILYPWMDSNLSTRQIDDLTAKFKKADESIGFKPEKYEAFVNQLEKKFKS